MSFLLRSLYIISGLVSEILNNYVIIIIEGLLIELSYGYPRYISLFNLI